MMNTLMNTSYQLITDTVLYLMGITVLMGAVSLLLSEFGVVDLLNKLLSPLMKPLYGLPGASALGMLTTYLVLTNEPSASGEYTGAACEGIALLPWIGNKISIISVPITACRPSIEPEKDSFHIFHTENCPFLYALHPFFLISPAFFSTAACHSATQYTGLE